ncbi:MAG: hypothetical protein B7Z26_11580, partial [Asticcacaulis sp. 32-58-5]
NLSDAVISSVLDVSLGKGVLDLTRARAGTYNDKGQFDGELDIQLSGFVYDRLENLIPGQDKAGHVEVWRHRLKWLLPRQERNHILGGMKAFFLKLTGADGLPGKTVRTDTQPFAHLARILSQAGKTEDAHRITRAKLWVETQAKRPLEKAFSRAFGMFYGFGYSFLRTFATLIAYVLLGAWWVGYANDHGYMVVDTQPVAGFSDSTQFMPGLATDTPVVTLCGDAVSSLYYAVDLMLPLDLRQENKCAIGNLVGKKVQFGMTLPAIVKLKDGENSGYVLSRKSFELPISVPGQWANAYWQTIRVIYTVIGWLVVSLAVLTFSGLLRQKDH